MKQFETSCRTCGRTTTNPKFCSRSCAAKTNNLGSRKHGKPASNCICCSQPTKKSSAKYCSLACQHAFTLRENVKQAEKTGDLSFMGAVSSRKRILKELQGKSCQICGTSEWMGKELMLIMDHIDGDSENWSLNNLRLICSNCDSQTDTYKSKNRGNGRFTRRQRLQDGKSY